MLKKCAISLRRCSGTSSMSVASSHCGSCSRTRDQLGVDPLLVAHGEHAQDAHPHHAAREGRVGDEHQHVERVAVAGQGVGDEAVVRRIGGGREEAAVQPDDVLLVVVLVLVAAARGDLDHHVDRFVGRGFTVGDRWLRCGVRRRRAHDARRRCRPGRSRRRSAHPRRRRRAPAAPRRRRPRGAATSSSTSSRRVDLEAQDDTGTARPPVVPLLGERWCCRGPRRCGVSPSGSDRDVMGRPDGVDVRHRSRCPGGCRRRGWPRRRARRGSSGRGGSASRGPPYRSGA